MKKFMTLAAILAALTMTITGCANNGDSSSAADSGSSNASTSESGSSSEGDTSSEAESTALTADQMAANALNAIEWPALVKLENDELAQTNFGFDPALCEEYSVFMQIMSAHLNEIVVIKPAEGKESELQAQLDAHFEYIKNGAAFYPDQELSANGAVMGKTDSGYLYIIVHEEGQTAADALMTNPPAEMPADITIENGVEEDIEYLTLCEEMAKAAIEADTWPDMQTIDDAEIIESLFGLQIGLCEDFYVSNQLVSSQLNEIVFVKPISDSEETVKAQLEQHLKYVQENAAFYPDQQPSADGAVMGTFANGYMYLIVHENGAEIASAIESAVLA